MVSQMIVFSKTESVKRINESDHWPNEGKRSDLCLQ